MKKLFAFLCALTLTLGLKAQTSLTQAVDFTATDVHGTEIHLFDILDRGQYVLIDFFYTTCGYCIQTIPYMVQSYQALGCNMHDVFYMEVDYGDNEQQCLNWVNTYGVEYPTIAGVSGGNSIVSQYNIYAFPTVILIAPDRSILIQDLYPIPNAQTVINQLGAHGIEQHDCNAPTYDPQVTVTIDEVTANSATVTFTPNADCAAYYYDVMTEAEMQTQIDATGLDVAHILRNYGFGSQEATSQVFYGLEPDLEYYVWVVPADINGELYEVQQVLVEYVPGPGEIMPDFTATDIDGNEIHLYDILDAGQAVLINFFLRDEYCPPIMPYVTEAYRLYGCNEHDVFFMEINPQSHDDACREWAETYGVKYPTISRDGGANAIVQSIPVAYYPTVTIIRPDHTYAYRDLYPIENLQTIVNALNAEGYQQYECPIYDETLTFSMDTIYVESLELAWITVYNNTAVDATVTTIQEESNSLLFTFDGEVMFFASETEEFTIPQGESIELGLYLDLIAKHIVPSTITLSGNLPDANFIAMVDYPESVGENETSVSLFPNPANDFVTLKGENLGTVSVYNTLGQKVDEFETNGNELRIATNHYSEGVYFVRADGQTLRFVVTH